MFKLHHLSNHSHNQYFNHHHTKNSNSTRRHVNTKEIKTEILNLLQKFYNELLVPNFPLKEELEEFEEFVYLISEKTLSDGFCGFHHFLFLEDLENKSSLDSTSYGTIAAAATIEYYPMSNCGLLGYLVVDEKYRGKKLTNVLMEHTKQILKEESSKRNLESLMKRVTDKDREILKLQMKYMHVLDSNVDSYISETLLKAPLSFIVECEHSDSPNQVMDPKLRQLIYSKLGFKRMKFDYVQRLSLNDNPLELLLLHQNICENIEDEFVNAHSIATFIYEFYKITYYRYDFNDIDNCYDHVMSSIYNCSEKEGDELKIFNESDLKEWNVKYSTFEWKEFIDVSTLDSSDSDDED